MATAQPLSYEDFANVSNVSMRARELASKLTPKLPSGQSMMHLYRPMHFPVRKFGKASIETRKSQCFQVVNLRYTVLLGVQAMKVDYGREVEHNWLKFKGHGVMTSDQPVEIYQQYISFSKAHGHVLVGGLGLGMAAEMMLRLPRVKSVTVIEKEKDVIRLIQPQIDERITVLHEDLYDYLQAPLAHTDHYDFAYHDIWYSCGESAWAEDVVPLYRLSRKAGIEHLGAWGEYEMQAQLRTALLSRVMCPPEWSRWKPYKVFTDACVKHLNLKLPQPVNSKRMGDVQRLMKLYLTQVGTPKWEQTFDWEGFKGGK